MSCYLDPSGHLSWDALGSYITPYVLGAPDELINHNARLACIELCRRSGILHDENRLDLQKGVSDYFLTTLCDYEVVRVFQIDMLNRYTIRPSLTKPTRPAWNGGFGGNVSSAASFYCGPYGFWLENVDVLKLTMQLQQDYPQGLRVEFIVQPKQDGCTLNNYLYEHFAEGISAGAISRLMLLKNTAWYDPALARQFAMQFQKEIARARTTSDMNFTSGAVMMQAERWI
jgi:hypothetical protein